MLDGDNRQTFTLADFGIDEVITHILIKNTTVWAASEDGISAYENSVWKSYKILYRVTAFDVDDNGTPWVGTNGGGVFSLEDGEWVEHIVPDSKDTVNNGVPMTVSSGSDIEALRVDSKGRLWILSNTQGIRMFDGESWRSFPAEETGFDIRIWRGMTLDQADRVWVVSFSGRLLMIDESGKWIDFTPLTTDISLYGANTISADPLGRIWVGIDEGIAVFTPPAP